MCRRLIISVLVLSFVCVNYTSAEIVYVDASEGKTGNTTLATGKVFKATVDVSGSDNLWCRREFANSGTVFESGGQYGETVNTENCPRLVTSVEVPENDYKVYVYFWSDTSSWRIQASLEDLKGDLPVYIANDPNGGATMAVADDFEEPVPMLSEGDRILWQAYLGTTGFTKSINVYIDDKPNHLTHNARTWYDGIGYEVTPVRPVHSYTFEDGTANDSVGSAHGTLVGGAVITDGALVTSAQDQWMEMPGDVIAINTYSEVSIEAWCTPMAGCCTAWSTLAYFGGQSPSANWGVDYFFISTSRGLDNSRAAISVGDYNTPWEDETGVDGPEYDDGLLHHMVGTLTATDISLYIDGVLIGSAVLVGDNHIDGISQQLAYLAKSGYTDPEWIGAIEEFNIYDQALSPAQVEAKYAAGPVRLGPEPVDPGFNCLLAYYPLDAVYRGMTPDASGNGNDGTINGYPVSVDGVYGQALDFNGDDYVDCGGNPLLGMQETNAMTAAGWITIRSIANQWAAIIAKGENAWRLGIVSLDTRFHFGITIWNAPDSASVDGATPVGLDEWHHVAGVFDGANIMVYLDGALDGNQPTTSPIGTNELNVYIGNNPEATGRYWNGLIDEVVIFNRALSALEIAYLAQ